MSPRHHMSLCTHAYALIITRTPTQSERTRAHTTQQQLLILIK